jgi:molecular chaperone DnaK
MATGKSQSITITSSSGLNKDEVDKLVREADSHAEADKKKKREVETRNEADMLLSQIEKLLSENRDKLSSGDVAELEKAVNEAKEAVKSEDTARIERSIETLKGASHTMAEKLYAAPSPENNTEQEHHREDTGFSGVSDSDDIIDAEFTEAS